MEPTFQDVYHPWPKQSQALWLLGLADEPPPDNRPVNQLLYGGMAGGGKSHLIRMAAAIQALRWPGSKFCITRRKTDDVRDNHFNPMCKEIPLSLATPNQNHMELRWENGSVTEFHHCEKDDDYLDWRGREWSGGAGNDESTLLPWPAIMFQYSRIRAANQPHHWKIQINATNPGGHSHMETKLAFVDAAPWGAPFDVDIEIPGPDGKPEIQRIRRFFLRSLLTDNPSLDYADVMAGLMAIPDPLLRRAQAFGDWDLPQGQMFDFDRRMHVIDPFPIPKHWPRTRAVDWGFTAPAACVWVARNPDISYPERYVYREWFARRVPTQVQARIIQTLSEGEELHGALCDPAMFRKSKGTGFSEAQEYEVAGLRPMIRANNNRIMGWSRIHKALYTGQGRDMQPELRIFNTCTELIKQLANVQRGEGDKWEDIKEPDNADSLIRDDGLDALRYALMGAAPVRTKPTFAPMRFVGAHESLTVRD